MNRVLACLVLITGLCGVAQAVGPNHLTVWIPEQHQTATLSTAGLKLADGRTLSVFPENYNSPLPASATAPRAYAFAGGLARLIPKTANTPARVEVTTLKGQVKAARPLPEAKNGVDLYTTQRGPCVNIFTPTGQNTLRCFSADLKTEWAKLSGLLLNVSFDGKTAYTTRPDWRGENPYSPDVQVIRHDLLTGQQTALTYRVPLDDQDAEYHQNLADTYGVRDTVYGWQEVAGKRFVVCATMTMAKFGCRLDVVNGDAQRLFSLQGAAYHMVPDATASGQRLYAMGNTLQVWDAATGKRLNAIRDPQWEMEKLWPMQVFLTPDGTQAAVITNGIRANGYPDPNRLTVFVYRLSDSKNVAKFNLPKP